MLTASPSAVKSEICSLEPRLPDVRHAGVDAGADRDRSGLGGRGLRRRLEDRPAGRNGPGRMVAAREAGDEQPDRLVADELVDDAALVHDRVGRDPVEGVQERRELGGPEALAEASRAADVGEQEAELDLGATDPVLGQPTHAALAELGVALPRSEPWPQDQSGRHRGTARGRACSAAARAGCRTCAEASACPCARR